MDGYLALLLGQAVPHAKPYAPPAAEKKIWDNRRAAWETEAKRAFDVKESLAIIRKSGIK